MDRSSRFPAALVSLGLITTACFAEKPRIREDAHAELIGKPAPTILADVHLNGTPVKSADLKGKVVLIGFWAVWCTPSVRSFPQLRAWHKEYRDQGLEVIGVTYYNEIYDFDRAAGTLTTLDPKNALVKADEQAMLRYFAAHHKLDYRLWAVDKTEWDRCRSECKLRTIPTMMLIDRRGTVRLIRSVASEETARETEMAIKVLLAEK